METEQIFQLGARLAQQAQLIQDRVNLLTQQVENSPWQGGSRDEFIMQFADCHQRLLQHGEQLYELRTSLYKEVEQWLDAAAVFGGGNVSGGVSGGTGWESWRVDGDLGRDERLVEQLLDFQNSEVGKRMAEEAAEAGLLFVIWEGGKIIARWGMPGGKEVRISWEKMKKSTGGYFNGRDQIKLNETMITDDFTYEQSLIHEMQHAIDYNKPNVNVEKINHVYRLTKEDASKLTVEQLEKEFADSTTERTKTEVNAFDICLENAGNDEGKVLDRSDGAFTKEEFDYVINERSYEQIYEDDINNKLKEWYGEDTNYVADVWVDGDGHIQVDIDQSRPWLERVWDQVF